MFSRKDFSNIYAFFIVERNMFRIFEPTIKTKLKDMKARASHTGKVIVKTSKMLKGQGIQYRGIATNGENSFLLTQRAYEKIQSQCKWEN